MKKTIAFLLCIGMLLGNVVFAQNADPFEGKEEINIAFIGGSITEGYGSSTYVKPTNDTAKDGTIANKKCYAGLVGQYFIDTYSDKKVNVYNAGMSGTTSELGLFRLNEEVIKYNPDMVFVEFAVNDWGNVEKSRIYMEGIVRELLKMEEVPIINFIYTTTEDYKSLAEEQEKLANYYGIPSHNLKSYVKSMVEKGRYTARELLGDGVHPTDLGYSLYANFIINNLKKRDGSYFVKPTVPEKLFSGTVFTEPRLNPAKNTKRTGAWSVENYRGRDTYVSFQAGATMTYEFYGTYIGIMNVCGGNFGKVTYVLDNDKKGTITANGASDSFNRNFSMSGLKDEKHTITFTVADGGSGVTGFGIACFLIDGAKVPQDDKKDEDINVDLKQHDIYVSPDGNDSADGSFEHPLNTIEQAKNAAGIISQNSEGDVNVILRGGIYNVGDGVEFDKSSTGKANAKINFKNYADEEVKILNSTSISPDKFKLVSDENTLKRIPQEARGKVYYVNLPSIGIDDLGAVSREGKDYGDRAGSRMLTVNDERFNLARWPNNGYALIDESFAVASGHKFSYSENKGDRWKTADEAWIYGFFNVLWADDSLSVKSIDCENKTISTATKHYYGMLAGKPWYIYNLIEELDVPGEWYLESSTGNLYVYPKEDIKSCDIRLSTKTTPLLSFNGAAYISFHGITFEGTCGIGANISDSNSITFDECVFKNIGQQAMRITGENNGIANSHIYDIGKGGVYISGGNTATLEHCNNYVENCHIERFSLTTQTYAPAVKLYGIGDRVSHCRINNAAHMGIYFLGNDNTIEYNEIYNVLKFSNDMGAIYAGRDWTAGGTVIKYNYIHDCVGEDLRTDAVWHTQGIYFDDGLSGMTIYGNIFDGVNNGVFIHYGRSNRIENNIFRNCKTAIVIKNKSGTKDTKGMYDENEKIQAAYKEGGITATTVAELIKRNYVNKYLPNKALYEEKYPFLKTIMDDYPMFPKYNTIKNNAIIASEPYEIPESVTNDTPMGGNFETMEDMSYEAAAANIAGFESIDYKNAGTKAVESETVGDFKAVYPENNSENVIADDLILSWEAANGANRYRLVVAEDADFEKIIYNNTVEVNYKKFSRLKYDRSKYYWKVYASSTSKGYLKNEIMNKNGVMCFRTAQKEELYTKDFEKLISVSEEELEKATEGTEGGKFIVGSKDKFRLAIESAKAVLGGNQKLSPYISKQKMIESATLALNNDYNKFLQSRNVETMSIGEILKDSANWTGKSGGYAISGKTASFTKGGSYGYTAKKIENYKKVHMRASFNPGSGFVSVALRAQNVTVQPWKTQCYIFLVKEDVIELQKFNGSEKFFYSVENTCLKSGTEHDIVFAALDTENGVQVTLEVDGEEIFNVADEEFAITDSGYFAVYTTDDTATCTIKDVK